MHKKESEGNNDGKRNDAKTQKHCALLNKENSHYKWIYHIFVRCANTSTIIHSI